MSSNLYLFDPKQVQSNSAEKPLVQVMREAELARSEESARIMKRFVSRVSGLFGSKTPTPAVRTTAAPAANAANSPVAQERLAA